MTAVRWCPWAEHRLLSTSHDGSLKVWDVRGAVPLHSVAASEAKLLAADWAAGELAACGGEDCKLHIYAQPRAGEED